MDIDPTVSPNDRDTHDIPQAVTDEELFEAYLSARLGQALETLNRARDELAAQPQDFNRALMVMRRVHELRDVQAQLDAQRDRVNVARTAAGLDETNGDPRPAIQATPGAAFRAAQAEQADKVMAALSTRPSTCPSCQALLEPTREQCGCGFTIAADSSTTRQGIAVQDTTPHSPA